MRQAFAADVTTADGVGSWSAPADSGVGPARRLAGRVASGHLFMVVAGLVAALLCFVALRDPSAGVLVAVADRDLRPGEVVTRRDLRLERVDAPVRVLDTLVTSTRLDSIRGDVVVGAISDGDL